MTNMSYADARKLADELPLMIHRLSKSQDKLGQMVQQTLDRLEQSDRVAMGRLEKLIAEQHAREQQSNEVLVSHLQCIWSEARVTNRLLSEMVAMQRHLFTDGSFDVEARKVLKQAEQRVY